MIKDRLINAKTYYGISEKLKKGFEWLNNTDLENIKDGRYYIDNDNIYANVQSYDTKADAAFEGHRRYIDIQYMIKGVEKIGITNYDNCSVKTPYSEENDIEFLNCMKNRGEFILREGDFAVFFPQDAHQPSLNPEKQINVKKVIVKVSI